jgi:hypothetical protein
MAAMEAEYTHFEFFVLTKTELSPAQKAKLEPFS